MTSLYYIHEPGVLHHLEERCKLDGGQKPYTFMANVLIAVNPLRELRNPPISEVVNTTGSAPHPYSIAEKNGVPADGLQLSTDQPTNQSVVISEEVAPGRPGRPRSCCGT